MTLGSTPEARRQQALDALQIANEVRVKRAKILRRFNAGEISLRDVFADPHMEKARIYDVLTKKKQWGAARVRRLLRNLAVSENRVLSSLSERQKKAIIDATEVPRRRR